MLRLDEWGVMVGRLDGRYGEEGNGLYRVEVGNCISRRGVFKSKVYLAESFVWDRTHLERFGKRVNIHEAKTDIKTNCWADSSAMRTQEDDSPLRAWQMVGRSRHLGKRT